MKRVLLLFIIVDALMFSCSSNPPVANPTGVMVTPETKVATLIPSPASLPPTKLTTFESGASQVLLFDDWPKDNFPNDAAKIMTITLERNILTIQVVYRGGCQEHAFALYAWTGFLMSNPPQGLLYLSHDEHQDTCTEKVEKAWSFDLTPLDESRAGRYANPLILRIHEPIGGAFGNEPFMPLIEWP